MASASSPSDKARGSARAALECVNKKVDPSCTECMDIPPVRAVILFPNLGTPLILPPGEKKMSFFIAAEAKSRDLFGVAPGGKGFPQAAPLGYMYVDKHLRVYPISAKALAADTKEGRLWNDGKLCSTAFNHVKVWCLGPVAAATITDVTGKTFANIRGLTLENYNNTRAAHRDPDDPLAANQPLQWLYQIDIDVDAIPNGPKAGNIVSLAWMIGVPACYKKQKTLSGMTEWEYQDKLIYDFLEAQKLDPKHHHVPDLFEFDIATASAGKLPVLKKGTLRRLKSWHPVSFGKGETLKLGHLTDVHVNSRQFALATSNACVIEGFSAKVGPKVDNCFIALKELFESMKAAGADAIFLTGDLLDFNRNLDPRMVKGQNPIDQYPLFDLVKNIDDPKLYPRGIDDMLIFSLLRYSYETLKLPVFMTTGNHEAYDVPYGISPRANGFVVDQALKQALSDYSVAFPARLRAARYVRGGLEAASNALSDTWYTAPLWDLIKKEADIPGLLKKHHIDTNPNNVKVQDFKMNDGIPADHNLTIYESCLIYGPSFPQVIKPFNFTPANYDWFFTLFTPLCDFRIDYKKQVMLGLDWGDSEIMVNLDISGKEVRNTSFKEFSMDAATTALMGAVMGLPRADKSINDKQRKLIGEVASSGKRVILFTHFTLINYEMKYPIGHETFKFAASDAVFNDFTKGTFSLGRDFLYPKLNNGINFTMSGHSHRSGVYCLNNSNSSEMSAVGYQPAEQKRSDTAVAKMHGKLFSDPSTTRVAVSSCSGPIGMQNLAGEMFGWNLMPPSGTLLDIEAKGALEFQRIVTKKYGASKPRFCVALDYVQVHTKNTVICWFPVGQGGLCMFLGSVLDAKNFVSKVTFYVWDPLGKMFEKFVTRFSPPREQGEIPFYFDDPVGFNASALTKATGVPPMVFAQIEFNKSLADHPLYYQYNFDDPWIIRVVAEITYPGQAPTILVAPPQQAQTPDWDWLQTVDPSRYPQSKSGK
jgi:hypothetical protein